MRMSGTASKADAYAKESGILVNRAAGMNPPCMPERYMIFCSRSG